MRVLALLALTACRITGTFECGLDEVCRRGDELGRCEVDGFCSFGDTGCASGRRYAGNAGDDLANTCVDESAEPLTCRERWRMNVVRFGAVEDMGVNSPMDDRDPWISPAGTQLFFSSTRANAMADIFQTTRVDTSGAFGTPSVFAALNSTSVESRVSFSADSLTVYLDSNRTGTNGGLDVWRATRTTPTSGFSAPDQATVSTFNTSDDEHDVLLANNGLSLYVAIGRTGVPQRIAVATRATTSDAFGAHTLIAELDTGGNDTDPALATDELLMVFTSLRASPTTGANLWYTTRANVTEKWSPPRLVPDVNIDGDEVDAFITADACTLVFSRKVSPAANYDLVYAVVTP